MTLESLGGLIPHPKDIDLTAETLRRVYWPKVVLIGSLRRAYLDMIRLYRELERFKVDALVPWPFFANSKNIREHDKSFADVTEQFNIEAHLLRIRSSDIAYVVNPGGYIGPNSTIDIGAALEAGKPVYSMERITDDGIAVMLEGIKNPQDIISIAREVNRSKSTS